MPNMVFGDVKNMLSGAYLPYFMAIQATFGYKKNNRQNSVFSIFTIPPDIFKMTFCNVMAHNRVFMQ